MSVLEKEPLHGYAVMEILRQCSRGTLDLSTGTLYPVLRRLERAGYLRSEWSTVGGRRRRTYRLTATGERVLADERSEWQVFAALVDVDRVLSPSD